MNGWTEDELAHFGTAQEVGIAGMRRDGTLRKPVIVWLVRLGDELYTRSVNGACASWFRGTQVRHQGQLSADEVAADVNFVAATGIDDELDVGYQRKYGQYPGPVKSITRAAWSRLAKTTRSRRSSYRRSRPPPHQPDRT